MTNIITLETGCFNQIMKTVGDFVNPNSVKEPARFIFLECEPYVKDHFLRCKLTASACDGMAFATVTVPCTEVLSNGEKFETFIPARKPLNEKTVAAVTIEDDGRGSATIREKSLITSGEKTTTIRRPAEPIIRAEKVFTTDPPTISVSFNAKLLLKVLKSFLSVTKSSAKFVPVTLNFYDISARGETAYKMMIEGDPTMGKISETKSPATREYKALLLGIGRRKDTTGEVNDGADNKARETTGKGASGAV